MPQALGLLDRLGLWGNLGVSMSCLPTVLNVLQCVGWGVFELVTIATAAHTAAPSLPRWGYVLIAGAATGLLAVRPLGSIRVLRPADRVHPGQLDVRVGAVVLRSRRRDPADGADPAARAAPGSPGGWRRSAPGGRRSAPAGRRRGRRPARRLPLRGTRTLARHRPVPGRRVLVAVRRLRSRPGRGRGAGPAAPGRRGLRAAPLCRALPRQWGHGDWHPSNLTWTGPGPDARVAGVLDLGLANRTFAVHDLATALERSTVDWLGLAATGHAEADLGAMDALLDGYRSVRPLSPAEAAALPEVLPVVHVEFALSEVEYFAGIVRSAENSELAYEGYLIGHARWFAAPGSTVLHHLRRRAAAATGPAVHPPGGRPWGVCG